MFVGSDDLADLVADRARIDLDVIVNHRQLAQQRLRDLAIRWNDDLAGFGVHHIERNFFAQKNVRKRIGQLFRQLFFLLLVVFADRFDLAFRFRRRQFFARDFAAR